MSANVATVNNSIEYFDDSHVHTLDSLLPAVNGQIQKMDSENRPGQIVRDEVGKFASGTVGGPGRRPITLVSEALKQKLAAGEAEKLADTLIGIANGDCRPADRIAAIGEITDRVEGKATQRIDTRGVFVVLAPEAGNLAALDQWADE